MRPHLLFAELNKPYTKHLIIMCTYIKFYHCIIGAWKIINSTCYFCCALRLTTKQHLTTNRTAIAIINHTQNQQHPLLWMMTGEVFAGIYDFFYSLFCYFWLASICLGSTCCTSAELGELLFWENIPTNYNKLALCSRKNSSIFACHQ